MADAPPPESALSGDPAWRETVHAMAMPFAIAIVRGDPSLAGGGGPSDEECAAAVSAFHRDLVWADDVFSLWRDDTPMARLSRGEITGSSQSRV